MAQKYVTSWWKASNMLDHRSLLNPMSLILSVLMMKITSIASSANADVLDRPSHLATDNASCAEVYEWHLEQ